MPLIRKSPDSPAPKSVSADISALQSPSPDERWAAARAAADNPDSIPALAQALAVEKDPRVRAAIFGSLIRIGSRESAIIVLPHLRSNDANIRTAAFDALRAMPDAAHPVVRDLLHDPDADVRILACDLLRGFPDPDEAAPLIHEILDAEPVANVCAAAVEVLAEIGDSRALPHLTRCAERFPNDPFLAFSIQAVIRRFAAPL